MHWSPHSFFELLVLQGFGIDLEAWRVWTAKLPQLRTSRCTSIVHHMGTRKPANIRRGIGGQLTLPGTFVSALTQAI